MTLSTQTVRLTGQELLDFVHANQLKSHTENCQGAGYFKDLNKGCDFIAYFEAILDARKANGEYQQPVQSGADWYDSLTEQDSELYDKIEDLCPEFTKFDAEQCQEFMDELSELGITTAQQFEDAYYYQSDSWNAEAEFAEHVTTEINCVELPDYVVVDWTATYRNNLKYDFSTIEFDGETYFFHNHF